MMKRNRVGIIVARFQVAELHDGHKKLIQTAIDNSHHVIIFLGDSLEHYNAKNPLSFHLRKQMILEQYPKGIQVVCLKDIPDNDSLWVEVLEHLIDSYTTSDEIPELYGSRDSFISFYEKHNGRYQTITIPEIENLSGTKHRAEIANTVIYSVDFRKGIIHAILNQK